MNKGIHVRISGQLLDFVQRQFGPDGIYESASEYIRDLLRKDYARQEGHKWQALYSHLSPGMNASEDEFIPFDAGQIIAAANKEKSGK